MSVASSKVNQSGAFGIEYSGLGADEHLGWGTDAPMNPLEKPSGFPYLDFEHDFEPVLERDTSVISKAFQIGEREVGRMLDRSLNFVNRFEGNGKQYAWMYGWEGKTKPIVVFKIDTRTNGVPGIDIFEDASLNQYTLLRQYQVKLITGRIQHYAVLEASVSGSTPPDQIGVLTDVNTTATDINFTGFAEMYEHLYEVSDDGKLFRDFRPSEITALGNQYQAGDKRTCMASMAKKFPSYSFRFQNTKCYKFGYKWSAAKFVDINTNWLGYLQERIKTTDPEYAKLNFDMTCSQIESNNIVAHNQARFEFAEDTISYEGTNMGFYGVTDANLDFEIPLQKQQDTESGLSIVDPVLNGSIAITSSITVTHSVDETFQQWRDDRTSLCGRISSSFGYHSQEILLKKFKLPKAGPDNGDVAAEPLELSIELACGSHPFEEWLSDANGNPEVMGSPVVFRVVDQNPYNEMTGRDLDGAYRPIV